MMPIDKDALNKLNEEEGDADMPDDKKEAKK